MTVFPNPISNLEELYIHFNQPLHGELNLQFINQHGIQVFTEWLMEADGLTSYRLRIYQLKRGRYTLKVINNGREGIQKLIIQ